MQHRGTLRPSPARAALAGAALGLLPLLALPACGTPADPERGGAFSRASMQGSGGQESLVSTRSIELVSWLVQFNRLNSAEKLEAMLNKRPGQFFPVDADADGAHDYIAVAHEAKPKRGAKALVLSARPAKGDETRVATLFFDGDWGFLGYERLGSGKPPGASTIAAAAGRAATYAAATPPPAASPAASGPLTLTIAAGGAMTLAGEHVGLDQLGDRAAAIARERPGAKLVIEADAAVAESDVLARVDVLTGAGITHISIAERGGGPRALAQADAAPPVQAVGADAEVEAGLRPATP